MNGLALCAGIGGLELGISLALGDGYRTVGYVEREAYAAAALVARMEDSAMDSAPIWDDIKTFDGRPWRGLVDIVSGGYPCQPFSVAGRRRGADDPRHLWPDVRRIVSEVQPGLCFFENVANHIRLGFEEVRADLRGMGYRVEAGLFSAAEVGAPHLRKRLFILAYRDGALCEGGRTITGGQAHTRTTECGEHLANPPSQRQREQDHEERTEPRERTRQDTGGGGGTVDDPELAERRSQCVSGSGSSKGCDGNGQADGGAGVPSEALAHPDERRRLQAERGQAEGLGPFPPGPRDKGAWAEVLSRNAWVAPSLPSAAELTRMAAEAGADAEPEFRRVADGLAYRVDRLRGCGNGVHPIVAAKAACCLIARAEARNREATK